MYVHIRTPNSNSATVHWVGLTIATSSLASLASPFSARRRGDAGSGLKHIYMGKTSRRTMYTWKDHQTISISNGVQSCLFAHTHRHRHAHTHAGTDARMHAGRHTRTHAHTHTEETYSCFQRMTRSSASSFQQQTAVSSHPTKMTEHQIELHEIQNTLQNDMHKQNSATALHVKND